MAGSRVIRMAKKDQILSRFRLIRKTIGDSSPADIKMDTDVLRARPLLTSFIFRRARHTQS